MYIIENYGIAVLFCMITMLCWGSWANTQKLASKSWRFELFYWDYVIGTLILATLFAFTLGSTGDAGRSFLADVNQAEGENILKAIIGGVVFNLANILLVAAIAIAGMSVAFPVGIGIALILGVIINYMGAPQGNPFLLFTGVFLVAVAIILDALAYRKHSNSTKRITSKGIGISIVAGILMSFFYRFVADSMAIDFVNPEVGKLTPYTAVFFFTCGIFVSNFIFNTVLMRKPIEGKPVTYKDYFSGNFSTHLTGILGGVVWCLGMAFSIIAAGKAGYAISYGLGQGATLIGALWGVFIWKEFKNPTKQTQMLLFLMFTFFILGLGLIIAAGNG